MTTLDPVLLTEWQAAIGRTETRHEVLEAESLRRYALAVDSNPVVEKFQPPLPHWAFFLPQPTDDEVGPDGQVWVVDWYNFIVQHNPTPQGYKTGKGGAYEIPLRDKTHGRIYRLVAKDGKPSDRPKLSKNNPKGLVAALKREDDLAAGGDRWAMLRLALRGNALFEASDLELRRGGVSYTIDTLKTLRTEHPDVTGRCDAVVDDGSGAVVVEHRPEDTEAERVVAR